MGVRQFDYYGASGVIDQVEDYLFDDELLLIAEDGANLVLRNLPLAIIARGKVLGQQSRTHFEAKTRKP